MIPEGVEDCRLLGSLGWKDGDIVGGIEKVWLLGKGWRARVLVNLSRGGSYIPTNTPSHLEEEGDRASTSCVSRAVSGRASR